MRLLREDTRGCVREYTAAHLYTPTKREEKGKKLLSASDFTFSEASHYASSRVAQAKEATKPQVEGKMTRTQYALYDDSDILGGLVTLKA